MKIAVSGATGSLGKAVMQHLTDQGHEVLGLGRNEAKIQALEGEGFTTVSYTHLRAHETG